MTAFTLALCAVTISLTTTIAGLLSLLQEPRVQTQKPPPLSRTAKRWYVVRSGQGTWFLNGEPTTTQNLSQLLNGGDLPKGGVGFLPSNMRTADQIGADLRWLQDVSNGAVTLQLESLHP